MTLAQALKELEARGSEQTRKTYRRYNAGENLYGVSFADLYALQKRIKTDHALALELWKTGNADARNLATLISDPAQATDKLAEAWAKESNQFLCFQVAKYIGASPLARAKAEEWSKSTDESRATLGWTILAGLAMSDASLPDAYFEKWLRVIQRDLQRSPNWVRYAMNSTLCAIGLRNAALQQPAIAVAEKIGKVECDMGDTACKVPEAAAYIRKGAARRFGKGKAGK